MRTESGDNNIMVQHHHQTNALNMTTNPPAFYEETCDKHARIAKIVVSIVLGISLIVVFFSVAILFYRVPSGAAIPPFLLASEHLTDIPFSGENSPIEVFVNDVGAAHSGNFWTWVTIPDTLPWRRKVIAQGYSSAHVRYHDNENRG